MTWRRIALTLGGFIALVSVAAIVFGGHAVKLLMQSRLSDALGHPVTIDAANFALEEDWQLAIDASGVRLDGPPSFADNSRLLEIDEVRGVTRLGPLLRGDVQLKELRLVQPRLSLVGRSDGQANWMGGRPISSDRL